MTKRKNSIQVSNAEPEPPPVQRTILGQPLDTVGAETKGEGVITTLGNTDFGFQMKPVLSGPVWNTTFFILVSMTMGHMGTDKTFSGPSWDHVVEQAERYILRFCASVRVVLDVVAPFVEQQHQATTQPILASMQISMAPETPPKPKQLAGKKRKKEQ